MFLCMIEQILGCDNADNDDQNVDKQDDDQIWSDGEVLV